MKTKIKLNHERDLCSRGYKAIVITVEHENGFTYESFIDMSTGDILTAMYDADDLLAVFE